MGDSTQYCFKDIDWGDDEWMISDARIYYKTVEIFAATYILST